MTGIDEHKRRTKKNYNHIRLILRMDIDFTKNHGLWIERIINYGISISWCCKRFQIEIVASKRTDWVRDACDNWIET